MGQDKLEMQEVGQVIAPQISANMTTSHLPTIIFLWRGKEGLINLSVLNKDED